MEVLDMGAWEAAGHIAPATRKQAAVSAGALWFSIKEKVVLSWCFSFMQSKTQAQGRVPLALRVCLPTPANLSKMVCLDLLKLTVNVITDML